MAHVRVRAKSILKSVQDVHGQLVLGRAMCNLTFAPFWEQNCQKCYFLPYVLKTILEGPILF